MSRRLPMHFEKFAFGSVHIDGNAHHEDVVIDRGEVRKRKNKPSKKFRYEFGHTPLSVETLEVQPAGDRHRSLWQIASDARSA